MAPETVIGVLITYVRLSNDGEARSWEIEIGPNGRVLRGKLPWNSAAGRDAAPQDRRTTVTKDVMTLHGPRRRIRTLPGWPSPNKIWEVEKLRKRAGDG